MSAGVRRGGRPKNGIPTTRTTRIPPGTPVYASRMHYGVVTWAVWAASEDIGTYEPLANGVTDSHEAAMAAAHAHAPGAVRTSGLYAGATTTTAHADDANSALAKAGMRIPNDARRVTDRVAKGGA